MFDGRLKRCKGTPLFSSAPRWCDPSEMRRGRKKINEMKKIVMALVLMPLMALAYETEIVDGIEWKYTISDGKATVGDGWSSAISSSTTGAITIPSTLGGCPVTSIGVGRLRNAPPIVSFWLRRGMPSAFYSIRVEK